MTQSDSTYVVGSVLGYSSAAVTAGQFLAEAVLAHRAKIGGVQVHADTTGTGAGTTVVDVLINGLSIFNTPTDRPTLAALATGAFLMGVPGSTALQVGDRVALQVASVSTTGHGRLKAYVTLERTTRSPGG